MKSNEERQKIDAIPFRELVKTVSNIIGRKIYIGVVEKESIIIASECKEFAAKYNCFLISNVVGLDSISICEAYHAGVRAHEERNGFKDNGWELLSGETEAVSILRGFLWLDSFGYFDPKYDQTQANYNLFEDCYDEEYRIKKEINNEKIQVE